MLFAFTLGIHLAKRIPSEFSGIAAKVDSGVLHGTPAEEGTPSRIDLDYASKQLPEDVDELTKKPIQELLEKSGARLTEPVSVELPEESKAKRAGSTSVRTLPSSEWVEKPKPVGVVNDAEESQDQGEIHDVWDEKVAVEGAKAYALEVAKSAERGKLMDTLKSLNALKIRAKIIQENAEYIVLIGPYESRDKAEVMGKKYEAHSIVDRFKVREVQKE